MMMLQLLIFALFFFGFGVYTLVRKKYVLGVAFVLLGLMLAAVAFTVIHFYPEKSPF